MKISDLSFRAELSVFGYEGEAEYGYLAEAMLEGTKPESLLTLKFCGVDQEHALALIAQLEQVTSGTPVISVWMSNSVPKGVSVPTGTEESAPKIPWVERSRVVSCAEQHATKAVVAVEHQVQELPDPQVELPLVVEKVGKVQRPRAKKDNGAKVFSTADVVVVVETLRAANPPDPSGDYVFPPPGHPNTPPSQPEPNQPLVQPLASSSSPHQEPARADAVSDDGGDIPFGAPDTTFDPDTFEGALTKYEVNLLQLQTAKNWREIWESLEKSGYTGVDDLTAVVTAYKLQVPLFSKVEPASLASHIAEWVKFRVKHLLVVPNAVDLPKPLPSIEDSAFAAKEHVIPPIDPNPLDVAAMAGFTTFTHLVNTLHRHGLYSAEEITDWCREHKQDIVVLKTIPENVWAEKIEWSITNLNFKEIYEWNPRALTHPTELISEPATP
jgi:hypothetical protein